MSKDEVLKYMMELYRKTKWEYFGALSLLNLTSRDNLNALYKEGKIIIHEGVNGRVVELVDKN